MKKVYTCFCTDVIHDGHLNIHQDSVKMPGLRGGDHVHGRLPAPCGFLECFGGPHAELRAH